MGEVADFQDRVWQNMVTKGFNTTDPLAKIKRIRGELDELEEALKKNPEHAPEELADVIIECIGLAAIIGAKTDRELDSKMSINEKRKYITVDGQLVKESQ